MRKPSDVYMRFGFFLGFISASTGVLYFACWLLDIPTDALWRGTSLQSIPLGKRTLLFVGPLVIGLIGGAFGVGVFARIGKGSIKVERFLGSLWHYSSTGSIVWMTLSFFQFLAGFRGAIFSQAFPAIKAAIVMLGSGLMSGALICVILLTSGAMIRSGHIEIGYRISRLGPLVVGAVTGITQCSIMNIPWWPGAIAGLLYPYILMPWAEAMCERDGLR